MSVFFYKVFSNSTLIASPLFNHILLSDSTTIGLPTKLSTFYRSGKSKNFESSIKVSQTIDIQSFMIMDLQLKEGLESDANYKPLNWESLGTNNLWIRDLGFYKFSDFVELSQRGDYFLSRYKTNTRLYIKNSGGEI